MCVKQTITTATIFLWMWSSASLAEDNQLSKPSSETPPNGSSVHAPVRPMSDGSFMLTASSAERLGDHLELNPQRRSLESWTSEHDQAVWMLEEAKPGKYDVHVTWAVPDLNQGLRREQRYIVAVNGKTVVKDRISTTGGADQFDHFVLGQIQLSAPRQRVTFRPSTAVKEDWVHLRSLKLVPAGERRYEMPPLEVAEGFVVEPVAVPPLVEHPIMGSFDERGRLYLAESVGVNRKAAELYESRPHRMFMIEDTDGDGQFDKSTVFAENLVLPNGAQWYRGALYVCTPPFIWRYEDTDGDGKADKEERIFGKFNFRGNSSAFHGPVLGPDGRFYWCGGQHGWRLGDSTPEWKYELPWTSTAPGVFSVWPDGSDYEVHAQGGLANPVEVTFTPGGDVFGTVAIFDQVDGRHDALVHWVYGGVYNISANRRQGLKTTGDLLGPLNRRGHVAPAGVMRYRGDHFGDAYRDNIFLCEFNTHKVYRLQIEREGSTYRARDELFLSSSSPYVHFTDVMEDADGSLLVIDTGGWFLAGCPTSRIARPEILGGVYRVRKVGAATPTDPRGLNLAWENVDANELCRRLDDPRFAVRDRAVATLAQGGNAVVPTLRRQLDSAESDRIRRNAVWVLCQIGSPSALEALRTALDDKSDSVRQAAVHSVWVHRDVEAAVRLTELVNSDEPAVRREAATALGRIGSNESVPALLTSLRNVTDRLLEHALIYALIQINDRQATVVGLSDPAPQVRRGALIALDRMDDGRLTRELVAPLLDTDDPDLVRTALDVISRHPGWADEITGILNQWLAEENLSELRKSAVRGAILAFRDDEKIQSLVGEALARGDTPVASRVLLLETIARSELDELPQSWREQIDASLKSDQTPVVSQAVATAAALHSRAFDDQLLRVARDASLSTGLRLAAAAATARSERSLTGDLFQLLISQCAPDVASVDRLTAARAIGEARLDAIQLETVVGIVAEAGPLELPALVRVFEQGDDPHVGMQLVEALRRSPGLASLAVERLALLLKRYPDSVRKAADPLFAQLSVDRAAQTARLAELEETLHGGDARRGEKVFFGKRASCAACHRVRSQGGQIGPNLTRIGEIRTRKDLLEAIVFPSASFARGFEPYNLLTHSGKVYSGLIGRETAEAIYLRNADRTEQRVPRLEIEGLVPSKVSVMPQGMDQALSVDQLRDLLAYLEGLK